jgi:hypothetical protein
VPLSAERAKLLRGRLDDVLRRYDVRTGGWFDAWAKALSEWNAAYARWKLGAAKDPRKIAAAQADQDVQTGKVWMEALRTKTTAARLELASFVELARVALDLSRTPDEITRTAVPERDALVVAVGIVPVSFDKESREGLPKASRISISRIIPVAGRWTLDVSGGLAFSGLRQVNYVGVPSPDTSGTGLVVDEGSRDAFDVAPAVMAHYVHTARAGALSWAAGPTLGITTGSPVRYLIGGCLELGSQARLVLSYGAVWGKLAVINGESPGAQLSREPLETKDVMRASQFGSVSFTIALPAVWKSKSEDKESATEPEKPKEGEK